MNCTSARVCGGNVGLVEEGSVLVGWPGAPGCTMTGGLVSACCAETDSSDENARVAARSVFRPTANLVSDASFILTLE